MLGAAAVWRALVGGLCVAAAAAIIALVTGEFDETHARVVLTSLGFSIFTALAAAGDALRTRARDRPVALVGTATVCAAIAAYLLALFLIWVDAEEEGPWRAFGVAALLALYGAHASTVLRAQRRADPPLVRVLVAVSIVAATLDTLVGNVAILGIVEEVDDATVRAIAVVLVLMILTTALPPLLRLLGRVPAARTHDAFGREDAPVAPEPLSAAALADALTDAADRLDAASTPAEARREAATLRALAARAQR